MHALGIGTSLEVDRATVALRRGDVLLLCTDGLTNLVDDAGIETVFRWHNEPEEICRALVSAANEAGGHDNVTVVVVRFDDERLELSTEGEVVEDRIRPEARDGAVSWRRAFGGSG